MHAHLKPSKVGYVQGPKNPWTFYLTSSYTYNMKRIWHHYLDWEEYHAGMWRDVSKEERKAFLDKAVTFTGNPDLYGSWMLKVVQQWPKSCEHNLSSPATNRQAWIGHAAACLALSIPEDITREAWWMLSQEQRDLANAKADEAISIWESRLTE